ncbi:hypothetical protein ACVWY2_005884 [Bradyrhizobium sp. JR6.1]
MDRRQLQSGLRGLAADRRDARGQIRPAPHPDLRRRDLHRRISGVRGRAIRAGADRRSRTHRRRRCVDDSGLACDHPGGLGPAGRARPCTWYLGRLQRRRHGTGTEPWRAADPVVGLAQHLPGDRAVRPARRADGWVDDPGIGQPAAARGRHSGPALRCIGAWKPDLCHHRRTIGAGRDDRCTDSRFAFGSPADRRRKKGEGPGRCCRRRFSAHAGSAPP